MNTNTSTQSAPAFYDNSYTEKVSAEIREIAREGLEKSGGRTELDYTEAVGIKSASGTGLILVSLDVLARQGFDGDPVFEAKKRIFWKLMDPTLGITESATYRSNLIGDARRDVLRTRLDEILEQKVFQNAPTGLDLNLIAYDQPEFTAGGKPRTDRDGNPVMTPARDAVGWARNTMVMSVERTTIRVSTNEKSHSATFAEEVSSEDRASGANGLNVYSHVGAFELPASAEDQYIGAVDTEREYDLDTNGTAETALNEYADGDRNLRGAAKLHESAKALHDGLNLPALFVPENLKERRALRREILANQHLVMESLTAFHDLISGSPKWNQATIANELVDLWQDYTLEDITRLLNMDTRVVELLALAAVTLPTKPGRDVLADVKSIMAAAVNDINWSRLIGKTVDAYVAEHHHWQNDFDNRAKETLQAIETLEKNAAGWASYATQVANWSGNPAGITPSTENAVRDRIADVLAASLAKVA